MSETMEEDAYPKMEAILNENGLQITLKVFIDSLEKLMEKRGKTVAGLLILETLKGLHAGYLRRYEPEDESK